MCNDSLPILSLILNNFMYYILNYLHFTNEKTEIQKLNNLLKISWQLNLIELRLESRKSVLHRAYLEMLYCLSYSREMENIITKLLI